MTGAEDEAVAVEPFAGRPGSNLHVARPESVGRGGRRPAACRGGPSSLFGPHQRPGSGLVLIRFSSSAELAIHLQKLACDTGTSDDSPGDPSVLPAPIRGNHLSRTEEARRDGCFRVCEARIEALVADPDGNVKVKKGQGGRRGHCTCERSMRGRICAWRNSPESESWITHALDQARDLAVLHAHGQAIQVGPDCAQKDARANAGVSRRRTSTKCRPNGIIRNSACVACRAGSRASGSFLGRGRRS